MIILILRQCVIQLYIKFKSWNRREIVGKVNGVGGGESHECDRLDPEPDEIRRTRGLPRRWLPSVA